MSVSPDILLYAQTQEQGQLPVGYVMSAVKSSISMMLQLTKQPDVNRPAAHTDDVQCVFWHGCTLLTYPGLCILPKDFHPAYIPWCMVDLREY